MVSISLYTIGDLHLSFGCDKPMDIFSGWENYVDRIYNNWQETIKKEDTVVIVGDISWGMTLNEAKDDFKWINDLNGTKIILKGNHDYWFDTKAKVDRFFLENGFDTLNMLYNNSYKYGNYAICGTRGWINEQSETADKKVLNREAGRLRLSIDHALKQGLEPIAFLHYPPVYYINECKEILDVLNEYKISKCYYGHIHGAGIQYSIDGGYKGISYRLVSCDYTDFMPVKVLD